MKLSALAAVPLPAAPGWGTRCSRRSASLPILLSVLLSLPFRGCLAQLDPVKNFCRRFSHQTAVIDRKLYIDGGFINYNPLSQYPTNYTNLGLLYHDLDTPGDALMPQLYANLTKNSSIPSVNGGTLWADNINKRFFLFGGEYHQHPPSQEFTLWSYDTLYDTWESFGSPPQDDLAAVSYGAGVSVTETGMAYYYGGWKSNNTKPGWTDPPKAMPWLIKYNMDKNTWSSDPGPDSIGRAEGVMTFIPIGDGGMLVYFGGVQDPSGNGSWIPQPTDTIFLYDVLSSKWYTQNATGTIPPMRRRFCGGATWAPDQSSYNIYIYGGAGMPPDTAGFDDIYVLTIPTFQWIKMHPTDGNLTGEYPHHSLSCNIIDGAQMIIIGGWFPTLDMCDSPDQFGVHNADLGQQNPDKALWQIYNPNLTTYAVPDAIISAVGGSPGGGAAKTAPENGFNNPDLQVLMTRKARFQARTPTRSIPTPTPTQTDEPEEDGPLSTAAIAGIAAGGAVALLAFVIGVSFLIRRHRRRRREGGIDGGPNKPFPGSPHDWSPQIPGTSPYQFAGPFPPPHPVELPAGSNGSASAATGGVISGGGDGSSSIHPTPPPGATSWVAPDGVTYELVNPALNYHASGAAGSSGALTGSGTLDAATMAGTGTTSSSEPAPALATPLLSPASHNTKVDSEGRLWVQVVPYNASGGRVSPAALSPTSPTMPAPAARYPSQHYHQHGHYRPSVGSASAAGYSPVTPRSAVIPPEPQELSGDQGRPGWHAAGGSGGVTTPLSEGSGWDAAHGRPRHNTFYHP